MGIIADDGSVAVMNYMPPAMRSAGQHVGFSVLTEGAGAARIIVTYENSPTAVLAAVELWEADSGDARQFEPIRDAQPLYAALYNPGQPNLLAYRLGPEVGRKRYIRGMIGIRGTGNLCCAVVLELYRSVDLVPGRIEQESKGS